MICPFCRKNIEDETEVCPNCGAVLPDIDGEYTSSHEKGAEDGELAGISFIFRSRLFLALLASLVLFAASGVLATIFSLSGGIFSFALSCVINLIPAVFAAFSAYAGFKIFSLDGDPASEDMQRLVEYPRVMSGYRFAYAVFAGIVSAFSLLFTVVIFGFLNIVVDFDSMIAGIRSFISFETGIAKFIFSAFQWFVKEGGAVVILLLLFFIAAVMTAAVFSVITYRKTKEYYEMLAGTAMGIGYNKFVKLPIISLYIFGILDILFGALTLLSNPATALTGIASGAYLIITAELMKCISAAQLRSEKNPLRNL